MLTKFTEKNNRFDYLREIANSYQISSVTPGGSIVSTNILDSFKIFEKNYKTGVLKFDEQIDPNYGNLNYFFGNMKIITAVKYITALDYVPCFKELELFGYCSLAEILSSLVPSVDLRLGFVYVYYDGIFLET